MKAIVIGANGYIARHLVKALKENRGEVLVCSNRAESIDSHPDYLQVDVTDPRSVDQLDFDADAVFVFAGLTGTAAGFNKYDDYICVNQIGLLNILDALKKKNPKIRVVFPSSRLVYKGQKDVALKEDAEKEFKTIYALTKYAGEETLQMYHNAFGLNYTIYRICVPYGNLLGGSYSYGTLGFMLGKAQKGESITLFGEGSQKRTVTHVGDICEGILKTSLLSQTENGVFNIGGETLSLLDAATAVAKKYGVGVEFKPWNPLDLSIESGDTIFDSTKLDALLGSRQYEFYSWLEQV
ncbi:NAD(P)-dependent oxidoreductase [Candidatus Roizmanbacteria bacterium]|nr:NAD(P)-dependent oxidoreductase [Candidatus Roizmanbacteria bacterium]